MGEVFLRDFKKVLTLKKGGGAEKLVGSGWEVVLSFRYSFVKTKDGSMSFFTYLFFLVLG